MNTNKHKSKEDRLSLGVIITRIRWMAQALGVLICIAFTCSGVRLQAQLGSQGIEIHPSAQNSVNEMRRRVVGTRYELRNATLVDLIRTAWDVQADDVIGGPEWIDDQRFDVSIPVPEIPSAEQLRSVLQMMLLDRFHLAVHKTTRKVPIFAISIANKTLATKALLKSTAGSEEDSNCRQQASQPHELVMFECRNISLAQLADRLIRMRASGYLFNYRVVEQTGLSGPFNFSVKWTPRDSMLPQAAASTETITIFDAFENQLGMKLALSSVSQPAIAVDRLDEQPTSNLLEVSAASRAALRFELATIKPFLSPPPCSTVRVEPGGRVRIVMTLKGLIREAWGDMNTDRVLGGTKAMESTCFEVVAKAPIEEGFGAGWNGPVWNGLDLDSMRTMLRALLIERFKLAAHMDQRVILGYVLASSKPKLRSSNPARRPGCGAWLPDDGKDPRISNPLASSLMTCHNVTMKQFAATLYGVFHEAPPVVDETGLPGRYDFSIHFTPPGAFEGASRPTTNDVSFGPNGAISIFEALSGQLGLKLQSRRMPGSVLIIDSANETPAEN
jgi:uncharacterized protein (TIGR03435 family)